MIPNVSKITELKENTSTAAIFEDFKQFSDAFLSPDESGHLKSKIKKEETVTIFRYPKLFFFGKIKKGKEEYIRLEKAREAGSKLYDVLKSEKIRQVQLMNFCQSELMAAFLEGLLLSCYTFGKYKKEKEEFTLKNVFVFSREMTKNDITELKNLVKAVFHARDLINEPLSYLTAPQLSSEIKKMADESGFKLEVFEKKKIEELKMGGLLAVNKGSIDPPTFNILEWNPEGAQNKNPVILVGKGIVYDTGGLSLKPTPKSMDYMKSDMGGAAVVAATVYALAKNKIPVHVVGLIPATDNRPDGNAYAPGDIITMYDGTTVEVKNTDAEGRLILADALSYAKKYEPQLVIDVATLTGAAEIIAGNHALIGMGNSKKYLQKLKSSGKQTYERLIELPLWEEYAKPLKSKIADLNNLGGREGQTTVAGKFLEHFTDYNWIHLDIAGVAFRFEKEGYRPEGGTGYGSRLLYNFLRKIN